MVEVLIELGHRTVGGQEEMIVDVALDPVAVRSGRSGGAGDPAPRQLGLEPRLRQVGVGASATALIRRRVALYCRRQLRGTLTDVLASG